MRWQATRTDAGVRTTFLGHLLAPAFVHAVSMRVCPACLREDGIRRDFWALAHVVACPRHGTMLVDTCPRCGRLFSPTAVGVMDGCVCGGALNDAEPAEAPHFALAAAANLATLVGEVLAIGAARPKASATIPPAFEGLGLNDYVAYLQVLGSAATTTNAEDAAVNPKARNYGRGRISRQPSIADTLSLLSGAESMMVDWPTSFYALLGELDGRGRPADEDSSFEQAFSTALGRSLRHPMRGQDGLPLAMIVSAVDAYWGRRSGRTRRRRRNLTTSDVVAKRLHSAFNAADLARAVGAPKGQPYHGRVLARVLGLLSAAERATADVDILAGLVRARALSLHEEAQSSLSPLEAKHAVEGGQDHNRLSGWDHPDLLQVDPRLEDLRGKGSFYSAAEVEGALARMRVLARRHGDGHGLSPLVSSALRHHVRSTWMTKTDLLLRLFRAEVAVYSLFEHPKLGDLLVDIRDIEAMAAEARADPAAGATGYLADRRLNELLASRHGAGAALTANELHRLVNAGLVRAEVVKGTPGRGVQVASHQRYCVEQAAAIAARRVAGSLSAAEAQAFGEPHDAGPLIRELRATGLPTRAICLELSRRGVFTVRGMPWPHGAVFKALAQPPGTKVPAIARKPAP